MARLGAKPAVTGNRPTAARLSKAAMDAAKYVNVAFSSWMLKKPRHKIFFLR